MRIIKYLSRVIAVREELKILENGMKQGFLMLISTCLAVLFVSCSRADGVNIPRPVNVDQPVALASPISAEVPEPSAAATPEPVVQVNRDPKTLVTAFYEFYLDGFPQMDGNEVVYSRFLTTRFYKEADKADDYDPFLDAQDLDETWKNNFSVSEAKITGAKAFVDVALKGETFKWVLRASLVKKSDVWKIDGIKNVQN